MTRLLTIAAALLVATALIAAQSSPKRYGIGTPATPDQIAALDIDVRPDGMGLPPGSGSAREGAPIYAQKCAPCHGANGEGGVGPKLAGGEAKLTFPNEADHIAWVETGSAPHKGQPYGDPARPGGQHIAKTGAMPPFKGTLTDDQIKNVVTFEREGLK